MIILFYDFYASLSIVFLSTSIFEFIIKKRNPKRVRTIQKSQQRAVC